MMSLAPDSRHARSRIEVNASDRPVPLDLFQRQRRLRRKLLGVEPRAAEKRGECHGEAAGVGSCNELFWGRADSVLETRGERIRRLLQNAALGRERALSLFQVTQPGGRCTSFHGPISLLRRRPGAARCAVTTVGSRTPRSLYTLPGQTSLAKHEERHGIGRAAPE